MNIPAKMMRQILLLVALCAFASSIPFNGRLSKNTILVNDAASISDLTKQYVYFMNTMDSIKASAEVMQVTPQELRNIFDMLKKLFEEFKELVSEKFAAFVEWIVKNWRIFINYIDDRAKMLEALVQEFVNDIKNMSAEQVEEALQFAYDHRMEIFDLLKDVVQACKDFYAGNWPAGIKDMVNVLEELDNLVDQIPELKDSVFREFLDWAAQALHHPIQTIKDLAEQFLNNVPKDNKQVMAEAEKLFTQFKDTLGPKLWAALEKAFHPDKVQHTYDRRN